MKLKVVKILILVLPLFSFYSNAQTVDVAFVYTPDGRSDFLAAGASELQMINHSNSVFSQIGSNVTFRVVGSYIMDNYSEPYYGYVPGRQLNGTAMMHYDLVISANKSWVSDVQQKREVFGADIMIVIAGSNDVLLDAGGQGPGAFLPAGNGGYVLIPGQFAWDLGILPHEFQHVFGVSHAQMDANDYSDVFTNAAAVSQFHTRTTNAYIWHNNFYGVDNNPSDIQYLNCAETNQAASQWSPSDPSPTLVFQNNSDETIAVFWKDYAGVEQLRATLPPQGGHAEITHAQHPWVVRSSGGDCLGGVLPKGANQKTLTVHSRH